MKTEKGVTLISVTIYVIVMLIVVSIITVLTVYFYRNVDVNSANEDFNQQYTRFNSYFTEEINRKGNKIAGYEDINDEVGNLKQRYIIFSSGNQYTFVKQNQAIYMNDTKIAENITRFEYNIQQTNGKTTITVVISKGDNLTRTTNYTLVD